ncbi:MAG TPA: hypothetical protein VK781_07915 [Solirubrobacteraceae bacterium]|jgi:hypothetical protein|nr:hypothetical protein [Solirubrobacteraceae bacterium]
MATSRKRTPIANAQGFSEHGRTERLTGGGTDGNERLTNVIGAALIVLLAVIGLTIVRISQLLSVHLFVGMLLIPPVLLKLSSTGYRFVRYYTRSPRYREKGAPEWPLRVIAPMVVLSSLVVFLSGIVLLFVGPSARATWFPIHKDSFFVWVAFMAIHVIGHLPSMPAVLQADYSRYAAYDYQDAGGDVTGRAGRILALSGALVAGAVLAILVIPEFGPWLHGTGMVHHHHSLR